MRMQPHNTKPQARFRGDGDDPYYLGIELEVEAPDWDAHEKGLELRKRPRNMYAKEDGSLSCGWELVTQPIGKSLWLGKTEPNDPVDQFFRLVEGLTDLGYRSHDGGHCGLHVHVCRKAFSGDSDLRNGHYYWFARLVNGQLFRRLCQREQGSLDRWANQTDSTSFSFLTMPRSSRYVAANVTRRTVEVRLFRGNLREERIRKAIEAVIAAIEFARTLIAREPTAESPDAEFASWVSSNKRIYPNLKKYIDESAAPVTQEV